MRASDRLDVVNADMEAIAVRGIGDRSREREPATTFFDGDRERRRS